MRTSSSTGFNRTSIHSINNGNTNHNPMEVSQENLFEQQFQVSSNKNGTLPTRRGQRDYTCLRSSGCNVGELLKLTNLRLYDGYSASSKEDAKQNNYENYSNANNQIAYHKQLTGGSELSAGPVAKQHSTNIALGVSGSMMQQKRRDILVTPLTGTNFPVQNLNKCSSNKLSSSCSQHQHHSRFSNFINQRPTFVDHHHQQVFANDVVFSSPTDLVETSSEICPTINNNRSCEQDANSLEYLELDSGRMEPVVLEMAVNQPGCSFGSVTLADDRCKTNRNNPSIDSSNQYTMFDCAVTTELAEVIRADYASQEQSSVLDRYQVDTVVNSYNEHCSALQDSGHTSLVSYVDSAGSSSFNESCNRTVSDHAHYRNYHTQEQCGQYEDSFGNLVTSANCHQDYADQCSISHNQQAPIFCYNQTSDEILIEPELKVCEWEGCENTFLDMEEFVKHLEDKHVNQPPREKNRYFCLWVNCKRNNQEFNARYKLLIHMRVHSSEKPYHCNNKNCGKSFSRLENLKIHVRSHTGEKPYKCNFSNCSKSFTNSSDRIKHHKTHKDPKPYSCNYNSCTKRYTDPSSLRKHLRTHKICENGSKLGVASSAEQASFNSNLSLDEQRPGESSFLTVVPSSALFVDPNQSYIHGQGSSSTNLEGSEKQHHSIYDNQLRRSQVQEFQQQNAHFSRSWCAGYTTIPSSLAPGNEPTPSKVQQRNQAGQCLTNLSDSRWLPDRTLEDSKCCLNYVGCASVQQFSAPSKILNQHLMRSLPSRTSSYGSDQHQAKQTN